MVDLLDGDAVYDTNTLSLIAGDSISTSILRSEGPHDTRASHSADFPALLLYANRTLLTISSTSPLLIITSKDFQVNAVACILLWNSHAGALEESLGYNKLFA